MMNIFYRQNMVVDDHDRDHEDVDNEKGSGMMKATEHANDKHAGFISSKGVRRRQADHTMIPWSPFLSNND